jgi:hypothetical protein
MLLILRISHQRAAQRFPDEKIALGLFFAAILLRFGAIFRNRTFSGMGGGENQQAGHDHHSY